MPMFQRGADVADFPEDLRAYVTTHGWSAVDDASDTSDEAPAPIAPARAVEQSPQSPAVQTTAVADDNTGEIHD